MISGKATREFVPPMCNRGEFGHHARQQAFVGHSHRIHTHTRWQGARNPAARVILNRPPNRSPPYRVSASANLHHHCSYLYMRTKSLCCCFLTLTDPLRIQPWSQDRRNKTKSNRESEISMESRQKRTDKDVASKGDRHDKIENINKNTQTVETN